MSLRECCWLAEKLPDNMSCGQGCKDFPRCLPVLELVRKLTQRRATSDQGERDADQ
jgi:hypothetical protein